MTPEPTTGTDDDPVADVPECDQTDTCSPTTTTTTSIPESTTTTAAATATTSTTVVHAAPLTTLPHTGTSDTLGGIGLALVAAGTALVAWGRRRGARTPRDAANIAALERALSITWCAMPPEIRASLDTETQLVALHSVNRGNQP